MFAEICPKGHVGKKGKRLHHRRARGFERGSVRQTNHLTGAVHREENRGIERRVTRKPTRRPIARKDKGDRVERQIQTGKKARAGEKLRSRENQFQKSYSQSRTSAQCRGKQLCAEEKKGRSQCIDLDAADSSWESHSV